ncbi:MAG TPA: pyruvate carboxylase, partial [Bryobacteraceae bacterium]|nr:pyruvate carboxylase [Bryobacteraceae bacterium]
MGLGDRWHELARTYAEVNLAFGDIVKVTPSSKVVGDMALFLVSHNMTIAELENAGPEHNFTLPNSVVEMFSGSLGEPEGGWPPKLREVILRGAATKPGRPGEHLPAVDFDYVSHNIEK